ncbi:peptidoglycan-binding protein [Clostridium sp. CT7]|nr:peptidoglycan-binding protein [Clostridium sp. CT7]
MDITEMEKDKSKSNKVAKGIIISFCALIVIYIGVAQYFQSHFYFGSKINGISVSGKTVGETKTKMASALQSYALTIKERDGKTETIKSQDINVKYSSGSEYQKLKNSQNPYKWILGVFSSGNSKMTDGVSYDSNLLKQKIDKLSCVAGSKVVEPKSPSFKYTDKGYVVVNEVMGNKVNKDALYKAAEKAVLDQQSTIDMETSGCYVSPKYTSKSPKVNTTKELLNKYVATKVTYEFGNQKESVDGSEINKWLNVNDNLDVTIDQNQEKTYLKGIFGKYNTVGKTRSFTTSSGNTVSVSGGDYGWLVNTNKEMQNLNDAIKKGQTITEQPTYSQKAASHDANDIGNTYVEVDLSKQHVWFYKNGSLVTQGDVVTGNVSLNDATPPGVYSVKYKERNATLKGQGYASPVSYWMPFNGGIGLHDAPWRQGQFGGSIYLNGGSHGCVNCPPELAETIFNNIDAGTPVVCF